MFFGTFLNTAIVIVTPNAKMNAHDKIFFIRIFSNHIFRNIILKKEQRTLHTRNGIISQPAITCSKLTIETLEQGVKYVQC